MRKILPVLLLLSLFSSCVTLFNGPYTEMNVYPKPGTRVVFKDETGKMDTVVGERNVPVRIVAKRSGSIYFPITLQTDTSERTIKIKPIHSWLYYGNLYPLYGLGFLVDYNNPNRFTYPHSIHPNPNSRKGYNAMLPLSQSKYEVALIPPLINGFFFNPAHLDFNGSVIGIGTGVNYHYSDAGFISSEIGTAVAPVYGGYKYTYANQVPYSRQQLRGWYINLRNHHIVGRFDLGYGLSAGEQHGKEYYLPYRNATYEGDSITNSYSHSNFGLSAAANFRITNSFYMGMNYQPQLMSIQGKNINFSYANMVILGFYWRWGIVQGIKQEAY
jgi:hypothetical protein